MVIISFFSWKNKHEPCQVDILGSGRSKRITVSVGQGIVQLIPTYLGLVYILFEGLDARGVYISREWVIVKKKCQKVEFNFVL